VLTVKVFSIGAVKPLEAIRTLLYHEVSLWQSKGIQIRLRESLVGNLLLFRCETLKPYDQPSEEALKVLKSSVARGLTNIIIEDYERLLVQRLVDENYAYLASADREIVKATILMKLDGFGHDDSKYAVTDKRQRKSRIWAKLTEYLEMEDVIILEGFITFRLKSYLDELYDLVEKTVEDHLIDREYKEFIRLLKYFMSKQKVKSATVNVVRRKDGFSILDSNLNPVEGEVGNFLKFPPKGIDLCDDDLIVSAVVTLSPANVVWHGPEESSPCYDLLKSLLENNFTVCSGCSLEETHIDK
jgi:putative sporulation protein YtxC